LGEALENAWNRLGLHPFRTRRGDQIVPRDFQETCVDSRSASIWFRYPNVGWPENARAVRVRNRTQKLWRARCGGELHLQNDGCRKRLNQLKRLPAFGFGTRSAGSPVSGGLSCGNGRFF